MVAHYSLHRPSIFKYYPFGIGHRACIGKAFVMVSYIIVFIVYVAIYNVSHAWSLSSLNGSVQAYSLFCFRLRPR